MEQQDELDIQRSLAGDEAAFGRIVDRYESLISRLMWRFSRDRGECDELVQEVFVQAYFSLRNYRGDAPLLHWLRRIGTRVGYRFWQRRQREQREVSLEHLNDEAFRETTASPSEAGELVHKLLARLPNDDRLVLTLQFLEDQSVRDIADHTGWSEGKIKMKAMRAKNKLKQIAEQENLPELMSWTN